VNAVERAETRLFKYAQLKPPFRRGPKERCIQYLIDNDLEIARFEELGFAAIKDERRRDLIKSFCRNNDWADERELGFNVWLLNEIMGPRTPGSTLFYRCMGCGKIRTYGKAHRACKCGWRRLNNAIPDRLKSTLTALQALAYGF
jgi:hypothetical protein